MIDHIDKEKYSLIKWGKSASKNFPRKIQKKSVKKNRRCGFFYIVDMQVL